MKGEVSPLTFVDRAARIVLSGKGAFGQKHKKLKVLITLAINVINISILYMEGENLRDK